LQLRLPPGYRARFDPDVLALQRADGSVVARFGCRGSGRKRWSELPGRTAARLPRAPLLGASPAGFGALLLAFALGTGSLARPDERYPDGGAQPSPLAVGVGASRGVRGAL
jgi:hypothetical protein